ncbi:NAD(P)-binding protein [Nocardioides panacis]|uniref:NAD(P)-binding protein n=1 Tax=Nocardioides panacis TaxID=2849501 RepID=A0A975SZH2_9ACTN|nr:NAD(P)-binding protein [Nocardioides panacis]QWZ08716.1 NAD(P)-binding protein [Nocardioides panacis]
MSDHYDVIIVGSGAGGGTLAHRLAPSGKRVLVLERGDWLPPGDRELGRPGGLRRQPLRVARHLVRRPRARVPAAGALLRSAAPRSSTAPRCTGCGSVTSASSSTTAASRRRGRSATT